VIQLVGFLLLVLGVFLILGPWALVAGGIMLMAAPEVGTAIRRRRA
jgi:hypothetical protein